MKQDAHGGDIYGLDRIPLDFSISLNPRGMPPEAAQAARESVALCDRYPDSKCRALTRAAARRDGVPEGWILWGNGASDLIQRLVFALKPCKALILAPTFSQYRSALELAGCRVMEHRLRQEEGFAVTRQLMKDITPGTELVLLCDPNNPTGQLMEEEMLLLILERCRAVGAVLAVDQCFLELTGADPHRLTNELAGGGLCLIRALTKSYAMAGLRLGYLLCADSALSAAVAALAPPWPVSIPAQAAGEAALTRCPRWPEESLPLIRAGRDRLRAGLEELGLWVCPSQANYILFHGPVGLDEALLRQDNILLRSCANFSGLGPDWYRAAVRGTEENEWLLAALARQLEG